MTSEELRKRIYEAALAAASDEGVVSQDQAKVIAAAAFAAVDVLLEVGAIEAPARDWGSVSHTRA